MGVINPSKRKKLERLEKELGIKFTHLELLNQALVHTSHVKSNQKEIKELPTELLTALNEWL